MGRLQGRFLELVLGREGASKDSNIFGTFWFLMLFEVLIWNCRDNLESNVYKACILTLFETICSFREKTIWKQGIYKACIVAARQHLNRFGTACREYNWKLSLLSMRSDGITIRNCREKMKVMCLKHAFCHY